MQMSKKISVLAAAMLAALSSAAGAVSLGDLEVRSQPGQPLDATLEIEDVDLSISPLLVRVAPPATYLREGVQWPREALDLRMARLAGDAKRVRVRVTGTQTLDTSFPLLIELNAGGRVTVREYGLERRGAAFAVNTADERLARTKHAEEPAPQSNQADQSDQAGRPAQDQKAQPARTTESAPVGKTVEPPQAAPVAPVAAQKPAPAEPVRAAAPEKSSPTASPTVSPADSAAPEAQRQQDAARVIPEAGSPEKTARTEKLPAGMERARVSEPASVASAASVAPAAKAPEPSAEKAVAASAGAVRADRASEAAKPASPAPAPVAVEPARKSAPQAAPVALATPAARAPSEPSDPSAASAPSAPQTVVKAAKSSRDAARPKRPARYAPNVVREYVAINGFNPNETFRVQRYMTTWSIAQLYWPSYPGALLEQVAVALRDKNPKAFVEGDLNRIIVGATLDSPTSDEVFAIDPVEAFVANHGRGVAIPAPTQNLIDAQRLSREGASEVAAAQMAAKSRGDSSEGIASAGRTAFSDWRADHPEAKADGADGAEGSGADRAEGPDVPGAAPEPSAQAEPAVEASAQDAEGGSAAAPEASAAAAASADASEEKAPAAEEKSEAESVAPGVMDRIREIWDGNEGRNRWIALGALALALAGGGRLLRRRRPEDDFEIEQPGKLAPTGTITLQREVEPSTEAQLRAVDATISEAVKNGTTAGAMGVGAMAYAEAQMEADRREAAESEAAAASAEAQGAQPQKEPDEEVDFSGDARSEAAADAAGESKAPAAPAQGKAPEANALDAEGSEEDDEDYDNFGEMPEAADQPWLSPDDDELPPLDEEDRREEAMRTKEDRRRLDNNLSRVNLSLEPEAAKPADAYVPPLASEPLPNPDADAAPAVSTAASAAAKPAPASAAPAKASVTDRAVPDAPSVPSDEPVTPPPPPPPEPIDKQRAQQEAFDAKIQLASSFIGLGARDEARELLEEVRKKGSDAQRDAAQRLLARLGERK